MSDEVPFDNVIPNLDKYETNIENYLIHKPTNKIPEWEPNYFVAFNEPPYITKQPNISVWDFMDQVDLKKFLVLQKKADIRNHISLKIGKSRPKGNARKIFVELMYNVTKFCKSSGYTLEKTGALLSQFYLTHLYFTSKLDMAAHKVYHYFKELTMCHTLPFPPNSTKIFSHKETKEIMELFCKLYLRNILLVRFLSLPNFAFHVNYVVEPELDLIKKQKKESEKKDKKEPKKDSKKGSKKGSKK